MEAFILLFFLGFLLIILTRLAYSKEINEVMVEVEELQNLRVDFVEIQDTKAVFTCHKLKKMFYIELDCYDFHHSEMESSYPLQYTPEGWGRHKITHNGKVYSLYEI